MFNPDTVLRRARLILKRAAMISAVACYPAIGPASAMVYRLAPIDLGSGYSLSGAITTNGTYGTLTAADISGWRLKVTSVNDIVYTPANTQYAGSGALVAGGKLLVPTSPDGLTDGGSLAFRSGTRFQVQVADFTGPNVSGGQALYVAGAAFDFLALHQPDGTYAVIANETGADSLIYTLVQRRFSASTTMSGTLHLAQASGPAQLTDWSILIRETQSWNFNPANSSVLADLGLSATRRELTVTPFDIDQNPGSFIIGGFRSGELNGVILGDFSYDPGGVAGYQSPLGAFLTSPVPLDPNGKFRVGAAVPEPKTWAMLLAGFGMIGAARRRSRRLVRRSTGQASSRK